MIEFSLIIVVILLVVLPPLVGLAAEMAELIEGGDKVE
jgi:hypothetical protein